MKGKPYYRLRELMYEKYGEAKFPLACIMVANWLNQDTWNSPYAGKWSDDKVKLLCSTILDITDLPLVSLQEAERLCQLFGLSTAMELCNP